MNVCILGVTSVGKTTLAQDIDSPYIPSEFLWRFATRQVGGSLKEAFFHDVQEKRKEMTARAFFSARPLRRWYPIFLECPDLEEPRWESAADIMLTLNKLLCKPVLTEGEVLSHPGLLDSLRTHGNCRAFLLKGDVQEVFTRYSKRSDRGGYASPEELGAVQEALKEFAKERGIPSGTYEVVKQGALRASKI